MKKPEPRWPGYIADPSWLGDCSVQLTGSPARRRHRSTRRSVLIVELLPRKYLHVTIGIGRGNVVCGRSAQALRGWARSTFQSSGLVHSTACCGSTSTITIVFAVPSVISRNVVPSLL